MTEQTSRLVIEISSEQAKKNAEELSKELVKIFTGGEKASDSTSKLGKTIQVTSNITQNFNTTVNNTTKALSDQEKQVNQNGLAIKEMAKFVAGYISISKGIAAADNYTQMAARIRNATSSAQEYNLVQERLLVTANTTFRALNEAQEVYLSLAGGMKSLGYSTKQTLDLSDSLSFAFTANATRADQAQSAMDALSKSMAKGTIDADAWISIVTGADNIIADMAKTTGKTESEIRLLGATGKASLEDLIKTLVATREQNEKLANNMENSFADGLTQLSNKTTVFLGKLNETTKLTGTLAAGLGFLGEHVDKLAVLGGIAASIYGGRLVAAFVQTGIKAGWATAAILTQTGAMNASTTAARSLYLALGGPVGLVVAGIGVASSFLLMKDSSKDVNTSLEEQGLSVDELREKYSQLNAEQLKLKALDAADAIETQNKKIASVFVSLKQYISDLNGQGETGQAKALQTYLVELQAGGERAKTAFANLEKQNIVSPHSLKLAAQVGSTVKSSNTEIEKQNQILSIASNKHIDHAKAAKTGAEGVAQFGKEAVGSAAQIKGLSAEVQKFINDTLSSISSNSEVLALRAKGISKEYAEAYVKLKQTQGLLGKDQAVDTGAFSLMMADLSIKQKIKNLDEQQAKSEKDRTEELEKQLKVLKVNEKVKANAAKYNFGGLEGKYGLPSGMLSAIHMIESRGNANAYNKGSGAAGGFQFLKGTGDQYGVKDRYNLAQSAEGAAKYLSYLLKLFNGNVEKAVRAYHAGEGNVQKGKNLGKYNNQYIKDYYGYMGGMSGFSGSSKDYELLLNDQVKMLEKTQEEAEKIRKDFMSKGLQEEQEYKDQLKKIRENSALSSDEKKSYEAQLTTRFEAQTKLNNLQQDYELNGFKYTEDQKLIYQRDSAKLQLDADGKYSDEVKALHKKSIDDQFAFELEKSKLAKDQRLLQSTEFYMSELQLAKARYDIEKRLIAQSNDDPAEKAFKTQMLELQNQVDMNRRLKDASMGWDSVRSQMDGSSARYQVGQERFNRMDVSQNLFDTQIADVERQKQEPGADLEKLAEVREQIWAAHNQRMIDIENQYQKDSLNLQLTQAQQLTGSFANMFRGILGESSGAYKTMFAMQQGFALTQAGMNLWSSVSDAYAKEPGTVWQKVAAGAKAALDQGTFLAMIQAITPQGFATGGHITGKGTGTSDDIPIMASNGEFMIRQAAVSKLGLVALNYMNKTGELPFQSEFNAAKYQFSLPNKQPTEKFRDGGLIGVSRMSNADVERRQFDSIQRSNSMSAQPKVIIINQTSQPVEATSQWDGNELHLVLREMQKKNEAMMDAKIEKRFMMSKRQGW
ncbi:tape measure protein [Acinetobacter bereziniae]|jgi:tape measure domain-containing protein|uniref:tape measure protein n=1 Tax=Acinetobacter bereziniae TaxID=106648 RepID=UPI00125F2FBD|nr:tape measure protein [Acinetobacter bereziniae]